MGGDQRGGPDHSRGVWVIFHYVKQQKRRLVEEPCDLEKAFFDKSCEAGSFYTTDTIKYTVAVYSWSIADNFVIDVYCRCLEILCQFA